MSVPDAVTTYYDALDDGDYEALREVLAPDFAQRRPDRTFEGREAFVRFMRDDRPRTDTVHAVDRVYRAGDADARGIGNGGGSNDEDRGGLEVAVRGRLLTADDREELVAFVDVFRVVDERIGELRTYTG
ncbi:nuclear transport factor 2 family protein [Halobium salinum]|uniref:Nuclear transport factor 2 family protein n=1 Tax=Halobium salinum TaxID=1364940 RepID=A0ABD5PBU6_9EURY|nr:nuclear transport factor 2 family protein [Halobium salinum]